MTLLYFCRNPISQEVGNQYLGLARCNPPCGSRRLSAQLTGHLFICFTLKRRVEALETKVNPKRMLRLGF